MLCKKCGQELPENVKFCPSCGHRTGSISQEEKDKIIKRKNILLIILIVIVLILAAAVVYLSFFRPAASDSPDITNTPNQIGDYEPEITTIAGAYESALNKLEFRIDTAPAAGSAEDYNYIYGEVNEVNTALTEQELTALLNYNRPSYDALKNIQIRINPDNTVDFSAVANTQFFIDEMLGNNNNFSDMAKTFPLLIFMPDTANITGNMSFEIKDNKTEDFIIKDATFMGIKIPASMYSTPDAKSRITASLDSYLAENKDKNGTFFDSLKIQNGELIIKGKIPSSLTREPINP